MRLRLLVEAVVNIATLGLLTVLLLARMLTPRDFGIAGLAAMAVCGVVWYLALRSPTRLRSIPTGNQQGRSNSKGFYIGIAVILALLAFSSWATRGGPWPPRLIGACVLLLFLFGTLRARWFPTLALLAGILVPSSVDSYTRAQNQPVLKTKISLHPQTARPMEYVALLLRRSGVAGGLENYDATCSDEPEVRVPAFEGTLEDGLAQLRHLAPSLRWAVLEGTIVVAKGSTSAPSILDTKIDRFSFNGNDPPSKVTDALLATPSVSKNIADHGFVVGSPELGFAQAKTSTGEIVTLNGDYPSRFERHSEIIASASVAIPADSVRGTQDSDYQLGRKINHLKSFVYAVTNPYS